MAKGVYVEHIEAMPWMTPKHIGHVYGVYMVSASATATRKAGSARVVDVFTVVESGATAQITVTWEVAPGQWEALSDLSFAALEKAYSHVEQIVKDDMIARAGGGAGVARGIRRPPSCGRGRGNARPMQKVEAIAVRGLATVAAAR